MKDTTTYTITGRNWDGAERLVTRDKETALELYEEMVQTHHAVEVNAERTKVTTWRVK